MANSNPNSGNETATKRRINKKNEQTNANEHSSPSKNYHTQANLDANHENGSILENLIDLDVTLTESLAVCADESCMFYSWRWIMIILEYSCHGVPWIVGVVIGILVSHQQWLHEILFNLLAVLFLDLIVVGLLKMIIRRHRPSLNKTDMFMTVSVDKFSFPSGHSTRAAAVTTFLLSRLLLGTTEQCVLVAWTCCVVLSRVLLGRHHVLDVLSGAVIGWIYCYSFLNNFWISGTQCERLIRPIQEELHL